MTTVRQRPPRPLLPVVYRSSHPFKNDILAVKRPTSMCCLARVGPGSMCYECDEVCGAHSPGCTTRVTESRLFRQNIRGVLFNVQHRMETACCSFNKTITTCVAARGMAKKQGVFCATPHAVVLVNVVEVRVRAYLGSLGELLEVLLRVGAGLHHRARSHHARHPLPLLPVFLEGLPTITSTQTTRAIHPECELKHDKHDERKQRLPARRELSSGSKIGQSKETQQRGGGDKPRPKKYKHDTQLIHIEVFMLRTPSPSTFSRKEGNNNRSGHRGSGLPAA